MKIMINYEDLSNPLQLRYPEVYEQQCNICDLKWAHCGGICRRIWKKTRKEIGVENSNENIS